MNERIQEFAHRCGFTEYRGDDGCDDESLTKFAELIVRECAKICDELQKWPSTEPRHCANDIRIHFGVEE